MSMVDEPQEHTGFFRRYYAEAVARLAQRYPSEQSHIRVDFSELLTYDRDLARDYLTHPDEIDRVLSRALANYSIPGLELTDVDIRVIGLNDTDVYSPLEVTRDGDDRDSQCVGVSGELSKVTEPKKEITEAAFVCTRCGETRSSRRHRPASKNLTSAAPVNARGRSLSISRHRRSLTT